MSYKPNNKLKKAKSHILAIVMDYDGTLQDSIDPRYGHNEAVSLILNIAEKGKSPCVITARGASGLKLLGKPIMNSLSKSEIAAPVFIGTGNGTVLYRYDQKGKNVIYDHGLSLAEIKAIIAAWQKVCQQMGLTEDDLNTRGLATFRKFLKENWTGYIPDDVIDISRPYDGKCFTEEVKVTVVLPTDESRHQEFVSTLDKEGNKAVSQVGGKACQTRRGDLIYAHITHTFDVDPKLYALRKIMRELNLLSDQVAVFGDMPGDNDRGLLVESKLPFAFTNDPKKPPYPLPGCNVSPVKSVHDAINFLLR